MTEMIEAGEKELRDIAHQAVVLFERKNMKSFVFGDLGLKLYDSRIGTTVDVPCQFLCLPFHDGLLFVCRRSWRSL